MQQLIRKRLSHTTHFAGRFGATYFITICCERRGVNQLCRKETAAVLAKTARIYHDQRRWHLKLLLIMPDHLHALIRIDGESSLSELIRDYKRITAKLGKISWQRNFFDHRLRHNESSAQKFDYISQNPVRAGLIDSAENWPYALHHSLGMVNHNVVSACACLAIEVNRPYLSELRGEHRKGMDASAPE
jgi:putative transposase